jgi:hypothetical protein
MESGPDAAAPVASALAGAQQACDELGPGDYLVVFGPRA